MCRTEHRAANSHGWFGTRIRASFKNVVFIIFVSMEQNNTMKLGMKLHTQANALVDLLVQLRDLSG